MNTILLILFLIIFVLYLFAQAGGFFIVKLLFNEQKEKLLADKRVKKFIEFK